MSVLENSGNFAYFFFSSIFPNKGEGSYWLRVGEACSIWAQWPLKCASVTTEHPLPNTRPLSAGLSQGRWVRHPNSPPGTIATSLLLSATFFCGQRRRHANQHPQSLLSAISCLPTLGPFLPCMMASHQWVLRVTLQIWANVPLALRKKAGGKEFQDRLIAEKHWCYTVSSFWHDSSHSTGPLNTKHLQLESGPPSLPRHPLTGVLR